LIKRLRAPGQITYFFRLALPEQAPQIFKEIMISQNAGAISILLRTE